MFITVWASEPQAQYDAAATQQPTGSIKEPGGIHNNINVKRQRPKGTNVHTNIIWK